MIEYNEKRLIKAINEVAATEAGQILLAELKDSCKWDLTIVAHDDPTVTQFYAAQRGLYGALRQKIRAEYLKQIEFNYKGTRNDGSDNGSNTRAKHSTKRGAKPSDRTANK